MSDGWRSESHVDQTWLGTEKEDVLDPTLPIVDAHHHLWEYEHHRYVMEDLAGDLDSGHRVDATIYVEATTRYLSSGPKELRAIGETNYVVAMARQFAQTGNSRTTACAGIVAFAPLKLGDRVKHVLEAQIEAGEGRVCGIRNVATWDPDPQLQSRRSNPSPDLLRDPCLLEGVRVLGACGLVFETWLYHTQLNDLVAIAKALPQVTIVIDHCGGPIGMGRYAPRRPEVFASWRLSLQRLAAYPQIYVKIGGLAMPWAGFRFRDRKTPPSSAELAQAWQPYFDSLIEIFGPERCIFESNFPVDNEICTYRTLWNAFKRVSVALSKDERAALFGGAARRAYGLLPSS